MSYENGLDNFKNEGKSSMGFFTGFFFIVLKCPWCQTNAILFGQPQTVVKCRNDGLWLTVAALIQKNKNRLDQPYWEIRDRFDNYLGWYYASAYPLVCKLTCSRVYNGYGTLLAVSFIGKNMLYPLVGPLDICWKNISGIWGWVLIFHLFHGWSPSFDQILPARLTVLPRLVWMVTWTVQGLNNLFMTLCHILIPSEILFNLLWVRVVRGYKYTLLEYNRVWFWFRFHLLALDIWVQKTAYEMGGNFTIVRYCLWSVLRLAGGLEDEPNEEEDGTG